MVWVGRDLTDHLVPTPLTSAGTCSTRPGCSELHPTWPSSSSFLLLGGNDKPPTGEARGTCTPQEFEALPSPASPGQVSPTLSQSHNRGLVMHQSPTPASVDTWLGQTTSVWAEVLHHRQTGWALGLHSSKQRAVLSDFRDTLDTCWWV